MWDKNVIKQLIKLIAVSSHEYMNMSQMNQADCSAFRNNGEDKELWSVFLTRASFCEDSWWRWRSSVKTNLMTWEQEGLSRCLTEFQCVRNIFNQQLLIFRLYVSQKSEQRAHPQPNLNLKFLSLVINLWFKCCSKLKTNGFNERCKTSPPVCQDAMKHSL